MKPETDLKYELVDKDLGILGGKELTINGNGNGLNGNNHKGVTVANGQTLNINDVAIISGFDGSAVTNSGMFNVEDTTFENAVVNSGTVNLNAGTLAIIISGTGTTNILEDVINNDKTITQNSVVVTGGLTTKADAVISANGIDNSGSVTLYDGTLASLIKGEGTTNIAGNVTNNV